MAVEMRFEKLQGQVELRLIIASLVAEEEETAVLWQGENHSSKDRESILVGEGEW